MKKPTRAEVLAKHLGLNEKTHPACYECRWRCNRCGDVYRGTSDMTCIVSGCAGYYESMPTLALPDPLAPGTAADAWLGVLVRWSQQTDRVALALRAYPPKIPRSITLTHRFEAYVGDYRKYEGGCWDDDPTPAIVRAMTAADSAFSGKMEGATP